MENKGQFVNDKSEIVPDVLFKASGQNFHVYITKKGISYAFLSTPNQIDLAINSGDKTPPLFDVKWARTDIEFAGIEIKTSQITTEATFDDTFNFFRPEFDQGVSGVRTHQKIIVHELYQGIDWVIYISEGKIKYDFLVQPGADISQIRMNIKGADEVILNKANTSFKLKTRLGEVEDGPLYCYTLNDKQNVPINYIHNDTCISFSEKRNKSKQVLVIDPTLVWSTYYGGNDNQEYLSDIVTDNSGNVFTAGLWVAGASVTTVFYNPGGGALFNGNSNNGSDLIISKFSPNGNLLWSTLYGQETGSQINVNRITCNTVGDLYVYGQTNSAIFPLQNLPGAYNNSTYVGGGNGMNYLLKFSNTGVRLWATFFNSANLPGTDIVTDSQDNVYITGHAYNLQLVNPGGGAYYQPTVNPNFPSSGAAFVSKFNSSNALVWSTYFGSLGATFARSAGYGLAVGLNDHLYFTGEFAHSVPLVNPGGGAFYSLPQTFVGNNTPADAFIAEFDNSQALIWSTAYAGEKFEMGHSVQTDEDGNVFVLGTTNSDSIPTKNPGNCAYYDSTFNGGLSDLFFLKFNKNRAMEWGTYFGGAGQDNRPNTPKLKLSYANKHINTCVSTIGGSAPTFNPGNGYFSATPTTNNYSGLHLQFNNAGALRWSSYIGTAATTTTINAMYASKLGFVVSGGAAYKAGLPMVDPGAGAFQQTYSGFNDFAIFKFSVNVLNVASSATPIQCNGFNNGVATITPSGGEQPYSYMWSSGVTVSTNTSNSLSAGNYTVTVVDATCATITTSFAITQPALFTVTSAVANSSCSSANGTASAAGVGGTQPYAYVWNNLSANDSIFNLSAGVYTVTVSDALSCSVIKTVTVIGSSALSFTVNKNDLTCNADNSGFASVSFFNGVGPYIYTWSNGSSAATANGLSAIAYTVTITDGQSCTAIASFSLTQPNPISLLVSQLSAANCGINNGVATASATGGNGGFSYSWSSGASSDTASLLQSGIYTVTVSDNKGCTSTTTSVIQNIDGVNIQATTTNSPLCNNAINGTATIITSGGVAPFNYVFSNGLMGTTGSTTQSHANLSAGNYTVTITDFNNCTTTSSFQLINPTAVSIGAPIIVDETCGAQDGSITLTASGGTGTSYSFIWSNGQTASATQTTINNLQSGPYSVTISDINNCSVTQTLVVNNTGSITANAGYAQSICEGEAAQLNGTGGTTYSWTPISALSNAGINNPIATPTTTTVYTLTVQTGTCTDTDVITVTVNAIPITTITSNQTIVSGSSIQLTVTGGNSYSWTPNTNIDNALTDTPVVNPIQTTTYTVVVTSAAGCTSTEMVTVTVIPQQVKTCANNESEEFVANVFSPNGDGKNDVLNVMGNGLTNISFLIYDRWGNKVFETNNQAVGWDGSYNNQAMNNGTYVFYLKATCLSTGKELIQKGNVSIVK